MVTSKDLDQLLLACEKEPIHTPGAIQPFGILLSVDEPRLRIRNASVNTDQALGIDAAKLVGRSFAEFVSADQLHQLQKFLGNENLREQNPLTLLLHLPKSSMGERWELSAHRLAGCLILELEPGNTAELDLLSFHQKIRGAVQALQSASNLQQLCEAAVTQVRLITGFDHVMLYRFTAQWHGVVIAEARATHMDAYRDHHFPASDIPAQARAVFLQNWLRMIPDVDYTPVALYPSANPLNGAPLDLGNSTLRSVSPIHLAYLRNMQVKATLTISLIHEGRLWGLIACHHASPRLMNTDSRFGAKMIGQLVSSQIQIKESLDDLHYRARLRMVRAKLVSYMDQEEDLSLGLVKYSPTLLDLTGASGAAASIYHDSRWALIGKTPSVLEIEQLVDWLSARHAPEEMFCTNHLSNHFPPARAYKEVASGLLAVSIPKSRRNYILWFRPEVSTTVLWAGDPNKQVKHEPGQTKLHPRSSFQSWQEIVEGAAEPWEKVEVEATAELRNSILALDLQREFRKEQVARAMAEQVSREKENMVHTMSHDLRTPLSIAKMTLEMLLRADNLSPETVRLTLERGLRATNAIERLATGVLELAKVENGTAKQSPAVESAEDIVREVVDLMLPLAEQKSVRLRGQFCAPGRKVRCEKTRIEQVLGNLISNALKFTPEGGGITVSVEQEQDQIVVCVADTGVGIAPAHLEKIFERFWQEDAAQKQGTGLGLAIAKEIVEQEGGKIWAKSTPGRGSSFFVCLPCIN